MEKNRPNPRRSNKKNKGNWASRRKAAKEREKDSKNSNYQTKVFKLENFKFDLYYRNLLDPILDAGDATTEEDIKANKDKDFEAFVSTLREKLPITFRVNPLNIGYETVTDLLSSDTFIRDW